MALNIFKIKERKSNIKTEIIGGVVCFLSMFYVLPLNATILSSMGMSSVGVFTMTAVLSFVTCLIMGFVGNYPLVLSTGMGLNSYLAYTVCASSGFTWQQSMIVLTISGLIFFVLSISKVRKIIIESMPKNIKLILSGSLGAFICFVGLKNSGIVIDSESTLIQLGSLGKPSTLLAITSTLICFGLTFVKNKKLSTAAVPICIGAVAIIGTVISSIMMANGTSLADIQAMDLPVAPWNNPEVKFGLDLSGVKDVFAFGLCSDTYTGKMLGNDIVTVLSTPGSYVAIFSIVFVNLFDTTATILSNGRTVGIITEDGKFANYYRTITADSVGAVVCGPLGTSTVTSFAESNIAIEMGSRTGLTSVVTGSLFLISAFTFPVFSIFTSGCVTAPALITVGALIFVNNIKQIDWNDRIAAFTCFISIIITILCYSISIGLGMALISYVIMMLFAKRAKEIKLTVLIITLFFVVSFALTAIMPLITK